jgi:lipopolysaccharide export system permease protein
MGFRLPGFLQLILPLGLFLGILLAYGRLYLESEMTVLSATGMSQQRLLVMTLFPATLVAVVVAWLSLSLAPQGANQFQLLLNKQDAMTEFDTLVPGRFQALRDGTRVTYTEQLSDDRANLGGVFISEKLISADKSKDRGISVLVAEKGRQEIKADGNRYLILDNGYRYDGNPGQADYRAIKYDTYGVLLPKPDVSDEVTDRDAMPTKDLLGKDDLRSHTELQWRLSLPLLVFIVTLMAVPLSRVNPRQGRFLKLLPAVLLYMAYLTILIAARGALEKGKIPPALGLWWVHALFLAIGLGLLYWEPLRLKMASRRSVLEVARG